MDLFGDIFWATAGPFGVVLATIYQISPPLVIFSNWGKDSQRHAKLFLWFVVLGWPYLVAIAWLTPPNDKLDGLQFAHRILGALISLFYYGAWLVLYGVVRGIVTWIGSVRPAADD